MTKPSHTQADVNDLLTRICRALDEKKAEGLRVLAVGQLSSITDYLVIATGTSEPHLRALRVELEKVLDAAKVRILGMDTNQGSGWLIVDAFDVMVHLFTPAMRTHYALENLWKDAVEVSVPALLTPAAAVVVRAKRPAAIKTAKAKAAKPQARAKKTRAASAAKPAPRRRPAKKA